MQYFREWSILNVKVAKIPRMFQFKTMKPDEYQLMLRNLQLHYQDFLKDSQDSKLFNSSDSMQIERDYKETVQYYDNLLHTLEKGTDTNPWQSPLCVTDGMKHWNMRVVFLWMLGNCWIHVSGAAVRAQGESCAPAGVMSRVWLSYMRCSIMKKHVVSAFDIVCFIALANSASLQSVHVLKHST